MSEPKLKGDLNAIKLWHLMVSSSDEKEQAYLARLSAAATQYGIVYFTDMVTERETGKSQTTWVMEWRPEEQEWEFSRFLIPDGAKEVSDRIRDFVLEDEIVEMDIEDLEEEG